MSFAELIRNQRTEKGYSQRKFAEMLGVNHTYISKIETGLEQPPSEELIKRMGVIFEFERFDTYAAIILSGKIPEDIKAMVLHDKETISWLFEHIQVLEQGSNMDKAISDHLREKEGKNEA
jgi:transcriptional regulator with XRE-family HTH domain